jgi:hypothetical protein
MKNTFMTLLFLVSLLFSQSLAAEVMDVGFEQSTDGSKLVTIANTLIGATSHVSLNLSLDSGTSFFEMQQGLSGDVGTNIAPSEHTMTLDLNALGGIASNKVHTAIESSSNVLACSE